MAGFHATPPKRSLADFSGNPATWPAWRSGAPSMHHAAGRRVLCPIGKGSRGLLGLIRIGCMMADIVYHNLHVLFGSTGGSRDTNPPRPIIAGMGDA
jgi:hypothetical protein